MRIEIIFNNCFKKLLELNLNEFYCLSSIIGNEKFNRYVFFLKDKPDESQISIKPDSEYPMLNILALYQNGANIGWVFETPHAPYISVNPGSLVISRIKGVEFKNVVVLARRGDFKITMADDIASLIVINSESIVNVRNSV